MNTQIIKQNIWIFVAITIFLNSCKIANINQPTNLTIQTSEELANEKLNRVLEAQGFKVLEDKNHYSLTLTDHWRGLLGKMAKLWPEPTTNLSLKYNFNTFDGHATFLSGKKTGDLIGVQSWQFYEKKKGEQELLESEAKSMEFGLVTLHYFIELPYRLSNAPLKRYYGQREHKGQTYDLVFVSWGSEEPSQNYDQYILWINTQTNLVDYCIYTLRDNTNPLTRHKFGSIAYLDYQDIDGFKVSTKMPVMLDDGVITSSNLEKYFHQFTIEDFSFGGFDESELYPLQGLEKRMDSK